MESGTVLLVDDENSIVQLARLYLEREGYTVLSAGDGPSALETARSRNPELMVLDVMLPGMDGFELCRTLRAEKINLPIIMLTARDEDMDKILGLELGADDYMTKPFNPRELVARVRAILRRTRSAPGARAGETLRVDDLVINTSSREVTAAGLPVTLRTQEFEVLLVLAKNRGRVLSREQLLYLAWGYDFPGQTRTVDVHVAQLRRKLAGAHAQIETVTGVGYKLVG